MRYKNDYLNILKEKLIKEIPNENTRKNYFYEINKAFKDQEFSNLKEFDYDKLKDYTRNIVNKRSASALKRSLDVFSETFSDFQYDKKFFENQVSEKSSRRTTKWSRLNLRKTLKVINFIGEDKQRLAYRTILATGLRVDELSNLRKKDITLKDDILYVFVQNGKYGKQRTVKAIDDVYLKNALIKYIDGLDDNTKLFYSTGHLKNEATKKGFACHDLRRAFSQIVFNNALDNENRDKAISEVTKQLGHNEFSTTYKKYLSRKIDFSNTKWE